MFKKLAALLIVVAACINVLPSYAAVTITDVQEQKELLKALNIAKDIPHAVSVEDFVGFLGGMLYEDSNFDANEIARMTGMISLDENLAKNTRITYMEAIKYAVVALGYKAEADLLGGYPTGYSQMAAQLDLTAGINLNQDAGLTGNAAAALLVNMLDAVPMKKGFKGEEIVYEKAIGETILSFNRGIKEIKGVVTANSITSLTKENGAGEGNIEIDGVVYETAVDFDDMLGKNVYAFIWENDFHDYEALYVNGYRNEELEINAESLEEKGNGYISYYTNEEKTDIAKAKLSPALRVIYNGVFLGDYSDADLIPENGNIALTDNNRDGIYDVAKIESYKTMVVASILSENETITNRYKFAGALESIPLDLEEKDRYVSIFDSDGKEIKFSDIKVDDVLSVAESRTVSPKVIKIYRNSQIIEDTLFGHDATKETLTFGGNEYSYISDLLLQLTADGKSLTVGKKYQFYTDAFNNIVYLKYVNELDYYIFYRTYEENEEYYVSYMDANEEWKNSKFAKNVTYEGNRIPKKSVYDNILYYQPQVVKLFFNSNGEIKEIKFAEQISGYNENKFTKTAEMSKTYRASPKTFGGSVWLEDSAVMFVFPQNLKDKEKYMVCDPTGYLSGDTSYKFTAYDIDQCGFTRLVSIRDGDNETTFSNAMFLVTDVMQKLVNDEVRSVITGVCGDFLSYQLTGETDQIFTGIKPGDVIQVHTNKDGRVDEISKVLSIGDETFNKNSYAELYNKNRIISGEVSYVNATDSRILLDCGNYTNSFRLPESIVVTIYNKKSRSVERGTIANIAYNDKVVCKVSYIQLQEVIVIRED